MSLHIFTVLLASLLAAGQPVNPVLFSDYSDPDVIRTGDDYWMTASSFNCVPGLQILHSRDLVNWEIVGAALPGGIDDCRQDGEVRPEAPEHGCGVWAPSIRFHGGLYWIFWGDPDRGIFQVHSKDPRGEWSKPCLVLAGKGLIDPCPLWDDDGRVYLVHGWAGSRAGFKSVLSACEMDPDCSKVITPQVMVFDGKESGNPTVEGPKFYRRGNFYYIFAPAGGVKTGWQLVLRSKSVYGPYEWRNVMDEGRSGVHGPHQGAWVTDKSGNDWFLHFEDRYAWGHVVHLQPMKWKKDWCVIGNDRDGDGKGEPVSDPGIRVRKSSFESSSLSALTSAAPFDGAALPLSWQWQAAPRPEWFMTCPSERSLRLNCVKVHDLWSNLWDSPNLLLEKLVGPSMSLTARVRFRPGYDGDRAGLVVMGMDYSTLELAYEGGSVFLQRRVCANADKGSAESVQTVCEIPAGADVLVRLSVKSACECGFEFSLDGKSWKAAGTPFTAREGKWIGAKAGFFAVSSIQKNDGGYAYFKLQ